MNNSAASIELVGGVLGNAESGIFTPSLNPAKQITISDSTIVVNDSFGILLQGEDPTPDDETITAGRHVVEDVTIVGSGVAGCSWQTRPGTPSSVTWSQAAAPWESTSPSPPETSSSPTSSSAIAPAST